MKAGEIVPVLKETVKSWSQDKAPRLAAALAYYTMFSIAPLVLIAIAIAGFVLGDEAAAGGITSQIQHVVGPQAAQGIEGMVQSAGNKGHGILATVVGLLTLLLGAAGVFGQLKDALNTIWGVEPKPGQGLWGFLKDRFLSLTMVLGVGFLLLVSLVLSTASAGFSRFLGGMLPGAAWLPVVLDLVISTGVITLLFALIFKVLPDAEVQWRDVWIGAFLTAVLFAVGKFLLGLYLSRPQVASAYGAAGSLVVLLLWVYYAAQILFFGAEFTKVYAAKCGSRIVPEPDARAVTQEAREEQGMPERSHPPAPGRRRAAG